MKKLLIVLFGAGLVSSANAQGYQKNNKEAVYNQVDSRHEQQNGYNTNFKERDQQISRITRDFEKQIEFARRDRFMKPWEKNKRISMLERQRDQQIKESITHYSAHRNDDFARNNRRF